MNIFTDVELPVVCIILIGLFALQHYGTHRIGFLFAPIVLTWLLCISGIGIYNIFRWDPHVYRAFSPLYMYQFLKKTQSKGWMSLGGILLCITGKYELLMIKILILGSLQAKQLVCFPDTHFHFSRFRSNVCRSWTLFTVIDQGKSFNCSIYE